jgi:hypothetical protein
MISIYTELRNNYTGQVELKWTVTSLQKEVCNFYGIPYLSEKMCLANEWVWSLQTLYQFNVTEYTTPNREFANRMSNSAKPWEPLIFDLNIFKDTYQITPSWLWLRTQVPQLKPWTIQQFKRYADTWEEVSLSFVRSFIWPAMYFTDMDVIYDVGLSE